MESMDDVQMTIELSGRDWSAIAIPAPTEAVVTSEPFTLVPEADGESRYYVVEGNVTVTFKFVNSMTASVTWEDDQFDGSLDPKDYSVMLNGKQFWNADEEWIDLIDRDPILNGDEFAFSDDLAAYAMALIPKGLFVVQLPPKEGFLVP